MKLSLSILFFLLCFQLSHAQQKIWVHIDNPDNLIADYLYLMGYKYGKIELIDSLKLDSKINYYYLSNMDYEGFALLTPYKNKFEKGINFILNPKEVDFSLKFKMEEFINGQFYFNNSLSNDIKEELKLLKSKYTKSFSYLSTVKGNLEYGADNYSNKVNAIDQKYDSLYHLINLDLDSITNIVSEDQAFVKKVLIPLSKMVTTFDIKTKVYKSRKELLQNEFFYFVDLNEDLIYHTPNIIDAFEFYLSNAIPFNEEGYYKAVDYFLEISKDLDPLKKDFIQRFLRAYFQIRNYDYVVDHFDERTSSCYFQEKVNNRKNLKLEEIKIYDNQGNDTILSALLSNDLNVIYVWLNWCDACKKKEKATDEMFSVLKLISNVNAIAVEIDNKPEEKEFPELKTKGVKSYYEKSNLGDSYILPYFGINSTPTYLLVDKQGKLIYKTNNPSKVKDAVFNNLMPTK